MPSVTYHPSDFLKNKQLNSSQIRRCLPTRLNREFHFFFHFFSSFFCFFLFTLGNHKEYMFRYRPKAKPLPRRAITTNINHVQQRQNVTLSQPMESDDVRRVPNPFQIQHSNLMHLQTNAVQRMYGNNLRRPFINMRRPYFDVQRLYVKRLQRQRHKTHIQQVSTNVKPTSMNDTLNALRDNFSLL